MTQTGDIPIVKLFGETLENFYQLGLKDRDGGSCLIKSSNGLVSTPWPSVNKLFQELAKNAIRPILKKQTGFSEKMKAYAEGLEVSIEEAASASLMPEFISFMDKWSPGIPHTLLGCSSFFAWDSKREAPIHGRILDFPMQGVFDHYERALLTQFDQGPKVLSYGSAGMPYPSITAVSSREFTLALHQKFTNAFHPSGTPIFELIFELLQTCHTKEDIIDFLKESESITCWCLNILFSSGEFLTLDIQGRELHFEEGLIDKDSSPHYFCNQLIDKNVQQERFIPYGMNSNNEMRSHISSLEFKKETLSLEKLTQLMGHQAPQKLKSESQWRQGPLTPSSLQVLSLSPRDGETCLIPGAAPKFFNGELTHVIDPFNQLEKRTLRPRGKKNTLNKQQGNFHLMQAQVSFDQNKPHLIYHHLQMAIVKLKGDSQVNIAEFFFLVMQYIYEEHPKSKAYLLQDFKKLEGKLPHYLNQHCLLFIARLEKIIKGSTTLSIEEFDHPQLQNIFSFEDKLPTLLFHKTTATLMNPRIDLLDIIYPHVRSSS